MHLSLGTEPGSAQSKDLEDAHLGPAAAGFSTAEARIQGLRQGLSPGAENKNNCILLCSVGCANPVLWPWWLKRYEQRGQDEHPRGSSTARYQALCHAINL
jgi:hypothetical protein